MVFHAPYTLHSTRLPSHHDQTVFVYRLEQIGIKYRSELIVSMIYDSKEIIKGLAARLSRS